MTCEWCGKPTDALGTCTGTCETDDEYRRDADDENWGPNDDD